MSFPIPTTKQMALPLIIPVAGVHVLASGAGGAAFGALLDGTAGGAAGAIAGIVVAIIVETIRTVVVLRKQRVDNIVLIDERRDNLEERDAALHAREIAFMQNQVSRAQQLELISRKRTHAAFGEVQRCLLYIRLMEERVKAGEPLEAFQRRSLEEIVADYPLPLDLDWTGQDLGLTTTKEH